MGIFLKKILSTEFTKIHGEVAGWNQSIVSK